MRLFDLCETRTDKTERPAVKPKAQDEEDSGINNGEESEDEEIAEESEDEVSEDDNGEDEDEIVEEEADEAEEIEEEAEEEEPEEESPEEGNGVSDGIPPAPEALKGRDIDLFLKGIRTAEADIPKPERRIIPALGKRVSANPFNGIIRRIKRQKQNLTLISAINRFPER